MFELTNKEQQEVTRAIETAGESYIDSIPWGIIIETYRQSLRKHNDHSAALVAVYELGRKEAHNAKDYCTQNDGDCSTCSLVSYGRDCMNNPL